MSQHFPGSPDLRRPDPMLHEMQLRPILSHLDELYGRDFSTYLDTAFELRSGESFEGRVTVESGKARAYIGGCSGCSNIDIELLDANARIVAGDNLPDNHPVLYFLPQASGAYTLRVTMRECSAAACVAGVRTMWTDNVLTK